MNVPWSSIANRAVRAVRKRLAPRAVILLYHRVAEVGSDPWSLCVTPDHFAEHLAVLRTYGHPMPLQQLVRAHREGRVPHRAVVVTFDDGYADNLHTAKPLLERYDIPATFFLTAGYVGQDREFWWDELDRLLLQPGTLPATLRLTIQGRSHTWNLNDEAAYSEAEYRRNRRRTASEGAPGSRHALYYAIWRLLQLLEDEARCSVLRDVAQWAGADAGPRTSHRVLSRDEAHALARGNHLEIGAHSVTHPFLSAQPIRMQREEIRQSKRSLEHMIERPISSFAYPFGDFMPETVSLIREAGFSCACTTLEETVWQPSDRLQWPRFEVRDWNGATFAGRLRAWLLR